jgi:hypothetical protein
MRSAITLVLGILLVAAVPGLRAQAKPQAQTAAKKKPSAAPQAAASPKTAKAAKKRTARKPKAPKPEQAAQPAQPASENAPPEASAVAEASAGGEGKIARRDPFESLVGRQKAQEAAAKNLPPGKAGLQVSTLRLDGIVKAPNGMIAVVTNPQSRTYFLREGDQLYDGRVEKIAMDGVSFHEVGKDAFGKPVERQVNKRIYSSAGEQQ